MTANDRRVRTTAGAASDAWRDQAARVGHAVSNTHRLRMLMSIVQCPKAVERLAAEVGCSIASGSAHLKVLQAAGLVVGDRDGRRVVNRLADDGVLDLLLSLRRVAAGRSAAAREAARAFDAGEAGTRVLPISPRELRRSVADRQLRLIDVRPADEYAFGHIPGAESYPHDGLADRLGELPRRVRLGAYCRGAYCPTTADAVRQMRAGGLNAFHLPIGVLEWQADGLSLSRPA